MTTNDEQHVPSEDMIRRAYVGDRVSFDGADGHEAMAEFDRFLARVRRDAAREALDGLADVHRRHASESDQAAASDVHSIVVSQALHYRDAHYPEETR